VLIRRSGAERSACSRGVPALVTVLALCGLVSPAPASATVSPDRPDTLAGATAQPAGPINSWLRNTVRSGTDIDYFKFRTSTNGYVRITLGNLAADYRLDLYTSTGTLMRSAQRSGVLFERIYTYASAGTYFVRVRSARGAFDAVNAYSLYFQPLSEGVQIYARRVARSDRPGTAFVMGDVLNNTSSWRAVVVTVTWLDAFGSAIGTTLGAVLPFEMAPRSTSHVIAGDDTPPAGIAGYTLTFDAPTSSRRPKTGLSLTKGVVHESGLTRYHPVTINNNTSRAVSPVLAMVAYYDARGRILQFWGESAGLAANGSATVEVALPTLDVNYTQYTVYAD
jgi:hypothetical protein